MSRRFVPALVAVVVGLAALVPAAPAVATEAGSGAVIERTLVLSDATLDHVPHPIPRTALVVAPERPAPASPVAVFLAGMHVNCIFPSPDGGDVASIRYPCPGRSIPNWRGYRYLQRDLASRGWITLSVDPNAVNALTSNYPDYGAAARAQLINTYLADWIGWVSGAPSPVPGVLDKADLSSVLLVGHSRGGSGMNEAARTAVGWHARGLFNLAPTLDGMNPAPGLPSVTLLGTCDDDVADLQGQLFVEGAVGSVDDRAMRSSVLVSHASHNAFNTVWSSDRWLGGNNSTCPQRQLRAKTQREVALAYLNAAVDAFGGRTSDLIRGPELPAGAKAWWAGLGGPVNRLAGASQITAVNGRGALCRTVDSTGRPCLRGYPKPRQAVVPNWSYMQFTEAAPAPRAVRLRGRATVRFARPLPASRRFMIRLIAMPGHTGRLRIRAWDSTGRSAVLGTPRTVRLPDRVLWAQPLVVGGGGLRDIARLRFAPRGSGPSGWLWDVSAFRPGAYPDPSPATQARVSVGWVSHPAAEQNGTQRASVTIRVSGRELVAGPVRLWVQQPRLLPPTQAESARHPDPSGRGLAGRGRVVTIPPGQDTVTYDLQAPTGPGYLGDTRNRSVLVRPLSEVVVDQYAGGLLVTSDAKLPVATAAGPTRVVVAPGDTMSWSLHLSTPPSVELVYLLRSADAGLRVGDVPARWIRERGGRVTRGNRGRPLFTAFGDLEGIPFFIPAGSSTVRVAIPTKPRIRPQRLQLGLANAQSMDFVTHPEDSLSGGIMLTARIRRR